MMMHGKHKYKHKGFGKCEFPAAHRGIPTPTTVQPRLTALPGALGGQLASSASSASLASLVSIELVG
jgi:hypothetical protein